MFVERDGVGSSQMERGGFGDCDPKVVLETAVCSFSGTKPLCFLVLQSGQVNRKRTYHNSNSKRGMTA